MTVRISQCEWFRATPERVWADIEDISSHPVWMRDAVEIRFLTEQRSGVGAEFETLTKVGPLRNNDVARVTEWRAGEAMTIEHVGVVTGSGRFTLHPDGEGTRFCWEEVLRFPWWMGGPLGERAAVPVLGAIWRKNLRRLKQIVEHP
jgi:hypothetical protein